MRAKQQGGSSVVLSSFHRRRCAVAAAGASASSFLKRHLCASENTEPVISSEPKVASDSSATSTKNVFYSPITEINLEL